MGLDNPGQPREVAPALTFTGSDHYLRGPVGKPSGLSIEAIALAFSLDIPRSLCNQSETISFVGAVVGSLGSYSTQNLRAAASR